MPANYTSFLICFHDNTINIYHEGQPLGCIDKVYNEFRPHEYQLPDGKTYTKQIPPILIGEVEATVAHLREFLKQKV